MEIVSLLHRQGNYGPERISDYPKQLVAKDYHRREDSGTHGFAAVSHLKEHLVTQMMMNSNTELCELGPNLAKVVDLFRL